MEFIYDILFKKYGEGEASLSAYRKWAAPLYFVLGAIIDVALYFIGIYTKRNMTVVFVIMGVIAVYFIYKVIYVLRSPLDTLHPSPDTSRIDLRGGKLEVTNPHGEKIFKLTLKNDASVKATYRGGKYTCTVINDEWDEVASFIGEDTEAFYEACERAISYADSLVKLPEGEYDDTPRNPLQNSDEDSEEIYVDIDEDSDDDEDGEDDDDTDEDDTDEDTEDSDDN